MEMAEMVSQAQRRSLIVAPSFASLDEIAAAIGLAHVLAASGENALLHIGKQNLAARIQPLFDYANLKFFQPRENPNEYVINVPAAEANPVRNVRWDEAGGEVNIYVELQRPPDSSYQQLLQDFGRAGVTSDSSQGTLGQRISISYKPRFSRLYLVGFDDLNATENAKHLLEHIDVSGAERIVISLDKSKQPLLAGSNATLAEFVVQYAKRFQAELPAQAAKNLVVGSYYGRKDLGNLLTALPVELQAAAQNFKPLELPAADLATVQLFWANQDRNRVTDLDDFQALLKLTTEYNPLAQNAWKQGSGGAKLTRKITTGKDELVITTEPITEKTLTGDILAQRQFRSFGIARSQLLTSNKPASEPRPAATPDRQPVFTPTPVVSAQPAAKPKANFPLSELNSLDYPQPAEPLAPAK